MAKLTALSALSLFVFSLAFVSGWVINNGETKVTIDPPYAFDPAQGVSAHAVSFAFAIAFSALFFGLAAPLVAVVEGFKLSTFYTAGLMPAYDLLYLLPMLFAVAGSSVLAQGVVSDYLGRGNVREYWPEAKTNLIIAGAVFALVSLARGLAVTA